MCLLDRVLPRRPRSMARFSSRLTTISAPVAVLLLVMFHGATSAFQPLTPQPKPGEPADFQLAEQLYLRAQPYANQSFQLGYTYYTGAVRGYRLARHWLSQNPNAWTNPDVQFGYREAVDKLRKARSSLEQARGEYQQRQHRQGIQDCVEMLGYVQQLEGRIAQERQQHRSP